MNTKIAVLVFVFLVFLSAQVAEAQKPAASLGLKLQYSEVPSTQECDDAFRVATDSGAQAVNQQEHPSIGNERKRIKGLGLKNRLEGSCLTGQTATTYTVVGKSIYPIEKVGVIARSVIFPNVLNQGQWIIDTKYPNASILCLDVANYSGSVTGLIWSMDRELVEEYDLQYLIDRASIAVSTCVAMFLPPKRLQTIVEQHATTQNNVGVQVANFDAGIAAAPEIEEKTPAVSMEVAKKAVLEQIKNIQETVRFAQTVESKQNE